MSAVTVNTGSGTSFYGFTNIAFCGFTVSVDGKHIYLAVQSLPSTDVAFTNELRAINAADGTTVLWAFTGSLSSISSSIITSPDGKAVYISQSGGTSTDLAQISAVNTVDGTAIWESTIICTGSVSFCQSMAPLTQSPLLRAVSPDSSVIFASATNGWYTAVNATTGKMKWQVKHRTSGGMSNLDQDGTRFVATTASGRNPGQPDRGYIFVLDTLMDKNGYVNSNNNVGQLWQSAYLDTLAYVLNDER